MGCLGFQWHELSRASYMEPFYLFFQLFFLPVLSLNLLQSFRRTKEDKTSPGSPSAWGWNESSCLLLAKFKHIAGSGETAPGTSWKPKNKLLNLLLFCLFFFCFFLSFRSWNWQWVLWTSAGTQVISFTHNVRWSSCTPPAKTTWRSLL